jgi:hypothetical protein
MQATGDAVCGGSAWALGSELAAGMEGREDDLDCGATVGGVRAHRDATAVVGDGEGSVAVEADRDLAAVTGHRFVNTVLNELIDEVKCPGRPGGAHVHCWTLSDGLEARKDCDVGGAVPAVWGRHLASSFAVRRRSRW